MSNAKRWLANFSRWVTGPLALVVAFGCLAHAQPVAAAPEEEAAGSSAEDPEGGEARGRLRREGETVTLAMELSEVVTFATDSTEIEGRFRETLKELVRQLDNDQELTLELSGHTDSVGRASYNMDLSRRRAEAVAAFLEARGLESASFELRAHGEGRPVGSNDSETGRARNRRVELSLLPQVAAE